MSSGSDKAQANTSDSPLTRQMPPGLFGILLAAAVLLVFYVVGRSTPSLPPDPNFVAYGKQVPEFKAETVDGKTVQLSDFKGKVVLLNYWATWCGPCLMEMPDLIRLQEKFGPKGFVVLGISVDEPDQWDNVKELARQRKLNYPVFRLTKELLDGLGAPEGLPTSYLVDKSGKVVAQFVGVDSRISPEQKIGAEVEKLL
jgi:cytochrome c biogenesis protein CcmG/thiol:disulfide interchange protein DsbE